MSGVEQTIRMNNLSKELRKYGFAQSSQEAISQAGQIYGLNTEEVDSNIELAQLTRAQLDEMIKKMHSLWVFKENTNQKISVLADQLVKVTDKLNELIKTISLIEMNQAVFDKKLNSLKDNVHETFRDQSQLPKRKESRHVTESSEKEVQKKLEKPIDRNGVAPADVSIEKIFYCGNR